MPADRSFDARYPFARYVGRVGALAVALGVGMAVATSPGIAFAETGDGDTPSATDENTETKPDDSQVQDDEPADEQPVEPEDDEPADEKPVDPEGDEDPLDEDPLDEDPLEEEDLDDEVIEEDPLEEELENDDSIPELDEVEEEPEPADDKPQEQPEDLDNSEGDDTPPDDQAPAARELSDGVEVTHDSELGLMSLTDAPPAPEPVALTATPTALVVPPRVQAVVDDVEDTVIDVASLVVTAALAPFVLFNPVAPQPPTMLWAVFAWVRREITHTFDNEAPTATWNGDTTETGDGVLTGTVDVDDDDGDDVEVTVTESDEGATIVIDDEGNFVYTAPFDWDGEEFEDTFYVTATDTGPHLHGLLGLVDTAGGHSTTIAVTVTVPAANDAPTEGDPPYAYTVDPTTGIVTGTVNVDDDDTDLTYTLESDIDESIGTVELLDPTTGAWQFTPTGEARLDAYQTPAVVAFTITATDPSGETVEIVLDDIPVDAAEAAVTDTIDVGAAPDDIVLSPDRRYAYVVTKGSNSVTVLDLSGADDPVVIPLADTASGYLAISPSGDKVYATDATGISVIDTVTGAVTHQQGDGFNSDAEAIAVAPEGGWLIVVSNNPYFPEYDLINFLKVPSFDPCCADTNFRVTYRQVVFAADPRVVATGSDGKLYLVQTTNSRTSIDVSGDLRGVALKGQHAYVADFASDTVKVVDLVGRSTVATIPVGSDPDSVAVHGDRVYVANTGDGTLSIIDTTTNTVVETVQTGPIAGLAVSADGSTVYGTNPVDGTVTVITSVHETDPSAGDPGFTASEPDEADGGKVTGTVEFDDVDGDALTYALADDAPDPSVAAVTVDPLTGIWTFTPTAETRVAALDGDTVSFTITATDGQATASVEVTAEISAADALVADSIAVGSNPDDIVVTPDGRYAYVVTKGSNSVTVVDLHGEDDPVEIPLPDTASGYLAISPSGDRVYVTHRTDVTVIDTSTLAAYDIMRSWYDNDVRAIAITGDGTAIYAVDVTSGAGGGATDQITVSSTANNFPRLGGYTPAFEGTVFHNMAVTPDGRIVATGHDGIYLPGPAINSTQRLPLSGALRGIAVPEDHAYVADQSTDTVKVVNLQSGAVVTTITVGADPDSVVAHGDRVYVANTTDGTVSIIDTTTNTVIETLETGKLAGLAVSSDGSKVYGTNPDDGTIVVMAVRTPAPAPEARIASAPESALAATDSEFTGQPSLVNQGFVAVLRALKPVLNALGISLNGSTASIPFFTDGQPPFFLLAGVDASTEDYVFEDGTTWKVWTLTPSNPAERTDDVVIGLHGGSFITTASIFHWWTYTDMVRDTGATVIVPMYPLATEDGTGGTAATVVPKTAELYFDLSDQYGGENVSVIGDSAGGAIALAAMQVAVAECDADPGCDPATDLPGHLVLFAPVLDAGLTDPNVGLIDDPILNADDSRHNGALWAGELPITDPLVSPIYGSLAGLPPTTVYAGSIDLRAADVLLLQQMTEQTPGTDFTFELRQGQVHDWLIFAFLPDAQAIRPSVYDALGLVDPV